MALAASITWWLADRLAGDRYSSTFVASWNTGVHFASFFINAFTIAKIKSTLDQRHGLSADLQAARAEIRRVRSLLALCPHCRRPRDPQTVQRATEAYLASHPGAPGEDTRCDACREADVPTAANTA